MRKMKEKFHYFGKKAWKVVGKINKERHVSLGKRQKFFLSVEILW